MPRKLWQKLSLNNECCKISNYRQTGSGYMFGGKIANSTKQHYKTADQILNVHFIEGKKILTFLW